MNQEPAFPTEYEYRDDGNIKEIHLGERSFKAIGLTKLEWFAGMALIGFLASQNVGPSDHKQMEANAEHAFTQAEYMIKESEKTNQ